MFCKKKKENEKLKLKNNGLITIWTTSRNDENVIELIGGAKDTIVSFQCF